MPALRQRKDPCKHSIVMRAACGVAVDEDVDVEEKTIAPAHKLPGELRASTAIELEAGRSEPIGSTAHWRACQRRRMWPRP